MINTGKNMRDWFIQKYSDLHQELNSLEHEIDEHLKNKESLASDDFKLIDLKRRTAETIELLNKTREDERRIFNY
jgi:hypothetical protein